MAENKWSVASGQVGVKQNEATDTSRKSAMLRLAQHDKRETDQMIVTRERIV